MIMEAPDGEPLEPMRGAGLDDRGLIRIGDTVRRPAGHWTTSVHHLLRAIRANGFELGPEPRGFDAAGREVLSYLPGHDQGWPFHPGLLTGHAAERLGRMTARLRHALACYDCPPDARWQFATGQPGPGQAVQHGDLGPWNLLWGPGDDIIGVLDWDFAEPGDPWYDTGHLAWFTVPCMDDRRARDRGFPEPPDRRSRLAAFATGAGLPAAELLRIVGRAQQEYADRVRVRGSSGTSSPWHRFRTLGFHENALADMRWTLSHVGS
jgi:hypothetical protein